ncbi:MAG: HEPN domain-containing protein [Suipraeoptans sp.]
MINDYYGRDLAIYKLDRAREETDTSELLLENDRYKAANNRAYFAITAVLSMEPVAFKRHRDTIAYFNKNYVNEGKFPKSIEKSVAKAAKVRHASDYDEFYIASREEAILQIQVAKELINLVDNFITKQ